MCEETLAPKTRLDTSRKWSLETGAWSVNFRLLFQVPNQRKRIETKGNDGIAPITQRHEHEPRM